MEAILGSPTQDIDRWEQAALAECPEYATAEVLRKLTDPSSLVRQSELTELFDNKHWEHQYIKASPENKVRLTALNTGWADGWLCVTPCLGFDTLLTNSCLSDSLKFRLGVDLMAGESHCSLCKQVMDSRGHHAVACNCGGDIVTRHNDLRNTVYREARKAGFKPELEKQGLLPGRRPADVLLHVGPCKLRPAGVSFPTVALDFAVVSPFTTARLRQQGPALCAAIDYAEQKRKHENTAGRCADQRVSFEPIVFEATGGVDPEAQLLLEGLRAEVARKTEITKNEAIQRLKARISIDLQRSLHRSLERRRRGMFEDDEEISSSSAYYARWEPGCDF